MSESPPKKRTQESDPDPDVEDYQDNVILYRLISRLPKELRTEHLRRIEHLSDDEASDYLHALHEKRDAALRDSVVSDAELAPYFKEHEAEIWKALETEVFTDLNREIGRGSTAKIQRFDIGAIGRGETTIEEVAVKYIVTPHADTISAEAEHDLILEVEQLRKLEIAERNALGKDALIRVPHPYFYYEKGKVQCYAMELIDGVNLERGIASDYSPELKADLRASLASLDEEALMREVDTFFDTMHGLCLHGDMKPANMMVSRDGTFYVIDFGQPKLLTKVEERHFETLQDFKVAEKRIARSSIRSFLTALNAPDQEVA